MRAAAASAADQPFSSAVFRATHNGYGTLHGYAIGHSQGGGLVDHTGNPASNALRLTPAGAVQ